IFGLFDSAGLDDSVGVRHSSDYETDAVETAVERLDISEAQIRHFLNSPLGAEIATRIQLQPDYCALIESDITIVNTGLGTAENVLDVCVRRLEKLLGRVRHDARRHSVLYWGDIADETDPTRKRLIQRLKDLL